jgi:hypothetical protein
MKKAILAVATAALAIGAGTAFADPVRDVGDLDAVHQHVLEAIREMERARAANHYDMAGHGIKAEDFLRKSEHELEMAVAAARAGK